MPRTRDDGEDADREDGGVCGEDVERGAAGECAASGEGGEPAGPGPVSWQEEPVEVPIGDTLDLHSFRPAEVADVVREYLDLAHAKGLRHLRIIHGRGVGVQRQTVRTLLARDPRVVAFGDAPAEAGGWGATWVRLL
jgi:dsDNA-specific endonuclease/ATPase MutS2